MYTVLLCISLHTCCIPVVQHCFPVYFFLVCFDASPTNVHTCSVVIFYVANSVGANHAVLVLVVYLVYVFEYQKPVS